MFTGIIEEIGRVVSARPGRLVVSASEVLRGVAVGGSLAVNGVCLTVTGLDTGSFSVDIMLETLKRTNLGRLAKGDEVNLARPLTLAKPLGGHMVQGHVDATGSVASIVREGEALLFRFEAPDEVMRYVVAKGFIAVDGISLTVVDREAGSFGVSVVDFTRHHTTLGRRRVGDLVNLEVDVMAKYVEQLTRPRRSGISADFLEEHGFLVG